VKKTKLILALAAAMPFAAHATDGYFANGYGMKANGMGGVAVAIAQEPFGGAVNPATAAFLDNQWQLGLSWFSPDRNASRTGSGPAGVDGYAESGSKNFFIPEFGINWKYSPDLAFGLTVYGNGGMNTDYPGDQISAQSACSQFRGGQGAPYNLMCGSGNLGVDLTQLIIAPYAAWQFAKGHSLGIAPLIAYQRFKAEGLQAFDNPAFSAAPGSVTNNGYSGSWGAGVRVGYMGQFTEQFAVGLTYSSKISMGDFGGYKGLFAQSGAFDIPSNFAVGVAFRPVKPLLVAVDYERIFYDDSASVSNPSAWIGYCPPPPMGAGQRQYCLGADSGAGFGWQNVDVWKIGVQYDVSEAWTIRGGYNHTDNPIGPQDVTFNILAPGVVKDQWSAGFTWRLDKASEITGAFMYAQNNSVTGSSLLVGFGLPPSTSETIAMKEYLLGIAYSRHF
jgi:long-chain fatty acid transport protein